MYLHNVNSISQVAEIINEALEKYFPVNCGVRIIAEPGTYFVESAFTLAAVVHSKRQVQSPDQNNDSFYNHFYIGCGIYTSFEKVMHDPNSARPILLKVGVRYFLKLVNLNSLKTQHIYIVSVQV